MVNHLVLKDRDPPACRKLWTCRLRCFRRPARGAHERWSRSAPSVSMPASRPPAVSPQSRVKAPCTRPTGEADRARLPHPDIVEHVVTPWPSVRRRSDLITLGSKGPVRVTPVDRFPSRHLGNGIDPPHRPEGAFRASPSASGLVSSTHPRVSQRCHSLPKSARRCSRYRCRSAGIIYRDRSVRFVRLRSCYPAADR